MKKGSKQLIYGLHAVEAALRNDPQNLTRVCVDQGRRDDRLRKLLKLAESQGIEVASLSKRDLDKQSGSAQHQGVMAEYRSVQPLNENQLLEQLQTLSSPFVLVLDGVQDPHNLGACLRSADAAGVDAVVVPKDRAAGITPVVRKVAAGAVESVPFYQVTNLARTLKELQELGVWVVGLAGEAEQTLYEAKLTGPIAIVMGAEGTGLRRLTREVCDQLIKIPMAGQVESLNVSVATGITLFEAARQQRHS